MKRERGLGRVWFILIIVIIIISSLILFFGIQSFPANYSIYSVFDINQPPRSAITNQVYHISNNKDFKINLEALFKDKDDDVLYFSVDQSKKLGLKILANNLVITPEDNFVGREKITVRVTDLKSTAQLDLIINVLEGKAKIEDYSHLIINVEDKFDRDVGKVKIESRDDSKFDAVIEHKNYANAKVEIEGGETDNAVIDAKFDRVADKEITTTVFGIDELNIDNATITLPKQGDVKSIAHCENFDVNLFLCISGWTPDPSIKFEDRGNYVVFTVTHFTAYGGINITNPRQTPGVGGNWTVNFTTNGTFDLNVTPFGGTHFIGDPQSKEETPNLEFISLKCGSYDRAIAPITSGIENDTSIVTFYAQNYNCDGETSYFTSRELLPGEHFLNFTFGSNSMIAENHASCGTIVTTSQTQTSNITSTGDCIQLNASNIVFDCNGFSIIGNRFGVALYATTVNNITIQNCRIEGFNYSIWVNKTSASNFTGNTLLGGNAGFVGSNTSNNSIERNTIMVNTTSGGSTIAGIVISNDTSSNISRNIINSTLNGSSGISVSGGSLMEISYNTINVSVSPISGYTAFTVSTYNDSRIIYNNISVIKGYRASWISASSYTNITNNIIFSNCVSCNGIEIGPTAVTYINFSNNNITAFSAASRGVNLLTDADNITVSNNTINVSGSTANYGVITSAGSTENNITYNIINSSGQGIWISSQNNTIKGNNIRVNSSSVSGIFLQVTSGGGNVIDSNIVVTEGGGATSNGIRVTVTGSAIVNNNTVTTYGSSAAGIAITSANNIISNNTVTTLNTSAEGIKLTGSPSSNNFTGDKINATQSVEINFSAGAGHRITNMTLVGRTNITALPENISIDVPDSNIPADPSGSKNISYYLNITNTSATGSIDFNISYDNSDLTPGNVDEDTITMFKYNDSAAAWQELSSSGVNTANNLAMSGAITSFSIFAPLGNQTASSNIDINVTKTDSPDPVNTSQDLTYQIILNASIDQAVNVTVNESFDSGVTFRNSTPGPAVSPNIWLIQLNESVNYTINITVTVGTALLNMTNLSNNVTINFTNSSPANQYKNATAITTVINNSVYALPPDGFGKQPGYYSQPRVFIKGGNNFTIPTPYYRPAAVIERQLAGVPFIAGLITLWKSYYIFAILLLIVAAILILSYRIISHEMDKHNDQKKHSYFASDKTSLGKIDRKISNLRREILSEMPEFIPPARKIVQEDQQSDYLHFIDNKILDLKRELLSEVWKENKDQLKKSVRSDSDRTNSDNNSRNSSKNYAQAKQDYLKEIDARIENLKQEVMSDKFIIPAKTIVFISARDDSGDLGDIDSRLYRLKGELNNLGL